MLHSNYKYVSIWYVNHCMSLIKNKRGRKTDHWGCRSPLFTVHTNQTIGGTEVHCFMISIVLLLKFQYFEYRRPPTDEMLFNLIVHRQHNKKYFRSRNFRELREFCLNSRKFISQKILY